jgi:hypothetical protein
MRSHIDAPATVKLPEWVLAGPVPYKALRVRVARYQSRCGAWLGTTAGVSGVLALALAHPGEPGPATTTAAAQPVRSG